MRFIDNAPHLYIYVNHGSNTTGDAFHHMVGRSLSLSRGRIERAQLRLCQALDTADHGLDEVTVMTGSGPVFTWRREAVAPKKLGNEVGRRRLHGFRALRSEKYPSDG